ncbi:MAG: methyltransferase domain-containing protein [Ignavibacteria bacterium]|jgi:ubiquinone/menaquinone biosynthesis C-methylase UbiE
MNLKSSIASITPKKIFPCLRDIYYRINRFIYSGKRYHCPICEKDYKKFLTGAGNKLNSRCPGCGTAERHRLLWLYLQNKLNIFNKDLQLLDIAPDQTIQKKLKASTNINYLSVDLESAFAMKKMDLTKLEFDDNKFDGVICYHVLEHIGNDRKALSEMFRVLKPGGWAILQSPVDMDREYTFEDPTITSPQEKLKYFGQEDHVRIYGRDYTKRLKEAGFDVIEDNYILEFDDRKISLYGLDKDEIIYLCKKPKPQLGAVTIEWKSKT